MGVQAVLGGSRPGQCLATSKDGIAWAKETYDVVNVGLGRIVTLYHRSSTARQIC
jgi:hypothetical protein